MIFTHSYVNLKGRESCQNMHILAHTKSMRISKKHKRSWQAHNIGIPGKHQASCQVREMISRRWWNRTAPNSGTNRRLETTTSREKSWSPATEKLVPGCELLGRSAAEISPPLPSQPVQSPRHHSVHSLLTAHQHTWICQCQTSNFFTSKMR